MALFVADAKTSTPGFAVVTERDYLAVLTQLIDLAQKRIDVLAFTFAMADAGGRLDYRGAAFGVAEKLKQKAKAGVRVRVYLEGQRDTARRNAITADHLRRAGCEVVEGATHAKGFSVDDRYVLFGSTNLTTQSMQRNNETNLLIDGDAKPFARFFTHLWKGGAHGGCRLKAPWYADGAFLPVMLKLIAAAERRLDFSIYYFHHPKIEAALLAAHRRGVRVTGLLNSHRTFHLGFVKRNRATVARLRAAGLDDLHFETSRDFTHSKYIVRDDREILLGTGNWVDEDVTVHPQLYYRLAHPKLARALARHLAGQISEL